MPRLIKNYEVVSSDEWTDYVQEELDMGQLASGKWILPLSLFLALNDQENGVDTARFGVRLKSDDAIESLAKAAEKLPLVVLNFQAFADGRSFSQARILREQYDFAGELRATGYFIQDQLFYLSRCGVNAFYLDDDVDIDSAIASLKDFSDSYQAACDEPQPLFRRRV